MSVLLCNSIDELLFVLAVTIDTLAISLVYGSQKIKIPVLSNIIINGVGTFVLVSSMMIGVVCKQFLPVEFTRYVSFAILCGIGILKCVESITKSTTHNADKNHDKIISSKESIAIATSISMDGMSIGIGAALLDINVVIVGILSFTIGISVIFLGSVCGRILAKKTDLDYTLIGGILIILFAFTKI